jgi:hypothetical protein
MPPTHCWSHGFHPMLRQGTQILPSLHMRGRKSSTRCLDMLHKERAPALFREGTQAFYLLLKEGAQVLRLMLRDGTQAVYSLLEEEK